MTAMAPVDPILRRLNELHPKKIDLSLDRMVGILAELGHPETRLPPVLHIAGTNGKGSTAAYLTAILQAAGHRVHRYISPHLVRFSERIMLADRQIDETELAHLLEEVERANAGRPITFFEITTAAAFLAFARHPADAAILEVGMGGRLDATNLVERPAVTVITPVSMDHETYLGTTLAAIAGEKAGILKPGVPCIVGPQLPEAGDAIATRAAGIGAPLLAWGTDWTFRREHDRLLLIDHDQPVDLPLPALTGPHQLINAATAAMAARHLPEALRPTDAQLATGLVTASWPGRWQHLAHGPVVRMLPHGWDVWLDGGHNEAAGRAIAATLDDAIDPRPLHLVVGMLNTKDATGFLAPLLERAASCTMVPVPDDPLSYRPDELAAAAARLGHAAGTAESVADAVHQVIARAAGHPARLLICGSLHLAGAVLAEHG